MAVAAVGTVGAVGSMGTVGTMGGMGAAGQAFVYLHEFGQRQTGGQYPQTELNRAFYCDLPFFLVQKTP